MENRDLNELLEDPQFAQLPLGPLAGANLVYKKSPYGTTFHGGRYCRETAKMTSATYEFPQPRSGTLADLNFPDAHCHFDEAFGEYIYAASELVDLVRENEEAAESIAQGGAPTDILRAASMTAAKAPSPNGPHAALHDVWQQTLERRNELVLMMTHEHHWYADRAVVRAVAAKWVAAGRRSGQYDPQFDLFLHEANTLFSLWGLTAHWTIRDVLSQFLEQLGNGRSVAQAIAHLFDEFSTPSRSDETAPRPLEVVALAWGSMLDALSQARASTSLAILDYERTYWNGSSLTDVYLSLWGGARFSGGGVDWVICRVPGVHQLHLDGSGTGHLLDEPGHADPERCTEILMSLVEIEAGPALAETVVQIEPGTLPFIARTEASQIPATPMWRRGKPGTVRTLRQMPAADLTAALIRIS